MKRVTVAIATVALGLAIFSGCCIVSHTLSMFKKDKAAPAEAPAQAAESWTCPMHPEVRQSAPGKCPICGMDLSPAAPAAGVQKSGSEAGSGCMMMGTEGH